MHDRLSKMFNLLGEYRREELRNTPALMLGDACKSGNIADVMLVLHHYPHAVHWRDSANGKTALHLAIENERIEIANILIQQGADLHAVDHRGISCLFKARMKGWGRVGENDEPVSSAQARRARRAYEDAQRAADTAGQSQRQRSYNASASPRNFTAPTTPSSYDATGKAAFGLDDDGYVLSSSGDVVVFNDHKEASRWILTVANRANVAQVFDIATHPTLTGKYSAKGRAIAPSASQRPAGPKSP